MAAPHSVRYVEERRKKMARKSVIALSTVVITLATSVSLALIFTSDEGTWPDTWPKELEQFRKQSKSYNLSSGTEEMWYEILFHKREEFEKAWPHVLKLKTKGAPLIIENTLTSHGGLDPIIQVGKPGVRILYPSRARRGSSKETQNRRTNWPDYIRLPSGELPKYGVYQDGKWTAAVYKNGKWTAGGYEDGKLIDGKRTSIGLMYRARVDIVLIVDGKIVDLNRIPLPADTPIIDKRFKEGHNKTDAGDGK